MNSSNKPSNPFQFPEVFIVEASAGSGKTYALAKRYIQLLLNPSLQLEHIPIRNILAITFTNKAAIEMKTRILYFLKALALRQISKQQEEDLLHPLGIDQHLASLKSFVIMESVIRNYNFFQVQTIDKFINALLSGCAFKTGLTANFKIKTNSKEYLQYSLDQLIDRAHHNPQILKIFEKFVHHYLYLENRSGWFPKDDMLTIICDLFAQNNSYGQKFNLSSFSPEDVIKKKKIILENIKELRQILPEKTAVQFVKGIDQFLKDNTRSFDVDNISVYFAREVLPVNKGGEISKNVENLWDRIRKQLKELCVEEAYSLFNPYVEIFDEVMNIFYQLSSRDDVLFLSELNKRAGTLFDEDYVTVEELYYRLATRFHHYLVDEFQDTSRLQWHNLEKMIEEALSTGGSLFYVGDKKQAIYSFRGGEVALFDDIKDKFNMFNVRTAALTNNWRSHKAIVEFNNKIFSLANLKRFLAEKESLDEEKKKYNAVTFNDHDVLRLENIFKNAQQTFLPQNNDGYVHVECIDIDKKQERDEEMRQRLVRLVKNLRERFAYRDIAVLTRGNQEVEQVTSWLLEESIPVDSERTSDIRNNLRIQELVLFLRFINSPVDNLSFSKFILSDLFTKASKLSSSEMHAFLLSVRKRFYEEKNFYIYTEFRQHYPKEWDALIDEFFKNVGLYPLYEFVVSIYNRFQCLDHFSEFQGFFMHFLELIKAQEEEHADLGSFLEYFEELVGEKLYVHVTDHDAVKVLTIHKSKGLEFPVVVLPFLQMDVQVGASSEDNQRSYVLEFADEGIDLLRLKSKYYHFSDELYQIYAREYKETFLSELNNIYVALTRPQCELYVYLPKKVGNRFNLANLLISQEYFEFGKQIQYKEFKEKQKSILNLPSAQYYNWIEQLKEEFLPYDDFIRREQKHKGEVLHYMLSLVGDLTHQKQDELLLKIVQQTKLIFPNFLEIESHLTLINNLLNKEALKSFFYLDEGEVFTEKEIVNSFGHSKRVDRLIVKKDRVWLLDYKSSREGQKQHQQQLSEYCQLVESIYPKKAVKGFLIYLDSLALEELSATDYVKSH